jgi:hypothetical protein
MPTRDEDKLVRGGVYLCQVGTCVSCGGCCGLYNRADLTRAALHAILAERTRDFARVPRTIDAVLAFEQERLLVEGDASPIPDFHHCVFVGLIEDGGERVGCLLHPLATGNAGVDWRGLSFYGGAACKHFFCPTYDELEPRFKRIAREALLDWYEYGLIIPEHRFLAAVFGLLETALGRALDPERDEPSVLRNLLLLRLDWPFGDPTRPLGWNFFSTRQTERPDIPGGETRGPQVHAVLRELGTLPELSDQAASFLEEKIRDTAFSLRG